MVPLFTCGEVELSLALKYDATFFFGVFFFFGGGGGLKWDEEGITILLVICFFLDVEIHCNENWESNYFLLYHLEFSPTNRITK